ncbi:hypothetical protein [Paenibacillus sp. PAMC 26794]|uniref:hypothetical protein n=1 Tax=Paenibacillus sp. PAMC 26794 TaxID=1257080 RepID=UPI00031DFE36|nr:hypothetical protein [Paenibacillus sp. PAMC 26794]
MILRKKWMLLTLIMAVVLLLAACGGKESDADVVGQDGPQDHSLEDFMPLSEGLENYSVWITTDIYPERRTYFDGVYVFANGEVTAYTNWANLYMRDIINLTDDEIIQLVKEKASVTYTGKYKLDITLDGVGQNTESLAVVLEPGYTMVHKSKNYTPDRYKDKGFSTLEEYAKELESNGQNGKVQEVGDDYIVFATVGEEPHSLISDIGPGMLTQKLLDKTYSGLIWRDDRSILTRVEDSFIGFRADGPDTKKDNVTIEGQ